MTRALAARRRSYFYQANRNRAVKAIDFDGVDDGVVMSSDVWGTYDYIQIEFDLVRAPDAATHLLTVGEDNTNGFQVFAWNDDLRFAAEFGGNEKALIETMQLGRWRVEIDKFDEDFTVVSPDGTRTASNLTAAGVALRASNNVVVGFRPSLNDRWTTGIIQELKVFAEESGDQAHYWKGRGNTESDWVDQWGNADGTLQGSPTLYDSSAVQRFATLDGSNDYFSVPDTPKLSFGNGVSDSPFSVCAWVRIVDSDKFRIASKSGNSASVSEWLFTCNSGGYLALYRYDLNTGNQQRIVANDVSPLGVWMHVCVTYGGDGSHSDILYVDGDIEPSTYGTTGGYTAIHSTSGELRIGSFVFTSGEHFANGDIRDVRIFDRVLSQEEINQCRDGRYVPGAVGHWKLDEASGTTAIDSSGNGHDATLNGDDGSNVWQS